jgi:GxxExxY protein
MEWIKIKGYTKRRAEFKESLGEVVRGNVIGEEYIGFYKDVKEIAEEVQETIQGDNVYEKEYRDYMAYKLQDHGFTVKQEKAEMIDGWKKVMLDISLGEDEKDRVIFELKRNEKKGAIEQLINYMKGVGLDLGFLIYFLKSQMKLYMIVLKEGKYYWYDGRNTFAAP